MKDNSIHISVIICTYNRKDSLIRTFESINRMTIPDNINWELIVVDNNSKDNTKEIVENFVLNSGKRCRYILEKNQGLSYARNSGIKNANGEIIVFTDDDVKVDNFWLMNIKNAFNKYDVACIGGKILPVWEKPCPEWLRGIMFDYIALCDLGENEIELNVPKIWGANLSIKAQIFQKYGYFNTKLGHIGGKLYGGEESNYLQTLLDSGEKIIYCPDILVHHCIPEKRLKKSYFRKWVFDKGELNAILMGEYNKRNVFGIPLIIIRRAMIDIIRCLRNQIFDPENAFNNQLDLFYNIGIINGRLKYKKNNTSTK